MEELDNTLVCNDMDLKEERISEENISRRIQMNDDYELYSRANDVTRRDTIHLLEEYSPKFQWKKNARVIDIGSGDGSVTEILSTYLPTDYEELIGTDVNKKSVNYAKEHHGSDKRIKFAEVNIEGEIPDHFKERFDHLFSFYTFQWIRDQEKAFTNIHSLLSKNGECFVIFLGYCHVYSVFYALHKSRKWSLWMKDFEKFASPYWDYRDPDAAMTKMLGNIGYSAVDVRCKQMVHMYDGVEHIKRLVSAINPFEIPKEKWFEFLDDFIEVVEAMKLIDEENGQIKVIYNLIVVHCIK